MLYARLSGMYVCDGMYAFKRESEEVLREREKQSYRQCEEGSRDWILVTTNQRTPKNASQLSEIGRNLSQSLQREHSPMHTLISDFLPPQL